MFNIKGLLEKLTTFEEKEGVEDLIIMSSHWDGYQRENAVRRLGKLGEPVAITVLIIRVNDWVPQVRSAAREALNKLMTDENAHAFLMCLPAISHLQHCGRNSHKALIDGVEAFLLKQSNVELVIDAIANADFKVARLCCDLVCQNNLLLTGAFIQKCFQSPDVLVRLYGAKLLRDLPRSLKLII
jgi:HEAT repeat protein